MTQETGMRGEKIYECDLALAGVTDYGVSMDDILAGKRAVPLHGARFDLHVDGPCKGRLSGRQHGVDYLRMRADGRIDLDLHVIVETSDGHRIAASGDGQAAPRTGEPLIDIFANIRLTTASEEYAWVNERQIWSVGTGDLTTGKIRVTAYMQRWQYHPDIAPSGKGHFEGSSLASLPGRRNPIGPQLFPVLPCPPSQILDARKFPSLVLFLF